MCGFILSSNNLSTFSNFSKISKLIKLRGPDFNKIIRLNRFYLAHYRLKIIDTNNRSNQPFTDKEKRFYLMFNGEIYNFLEIKKKYRLKCETKSDTEILFLLLKKYGIEKTLSIIEGMFSFIFIDKKNNIIQGARDHFGQKPLYYYHNNSDIIFSTNIKPISKLTNNKSFDMESVYKYLSSSGIIEGNKTFFKRINSLEAGNYIEFKNGTLKIKKYFHPSDLFDIKMYKSLKKKTDKEILKLLNLKIHDAVKKHLISDVPTGICLSGGVDSSLLTFYALRENDKIKTFSGFSKEIEHIPEKIIPKIINKLKIKNSHFIKHNKKKYFEILDELLKFSYSPSRWGGGVPMSVICKKAKNEKVSVLLGGDGVDEISGGYYSLKEIFAGNFKKKYHSIITLDKKNPFFKKRLNQNFEVYLEKNKKLILKKLNKINSKDEKFKLSTFLLDTSIFLQTCTLPHSDEYSMLRSVELRNPFLDLKLVKFITNLKSSLKVNIKKNNLNHKYIIKELAKKEIGNFIDQPKEGTRNYSKKISNARFWDFSKFLIKKHINELKNKNFNIKLDFKTIFKLISLEIIYRDLNNIKNDILKDAITNQGASFFYEKKK